MLREEEEGNLLDADADALINTVNTVGVMGKGIALQFKQAYPGNFQAYEAACRHGEVRLGKMFTYETGLLGDQGTLARQVTAQRPQGGPSRPTAGHRRARYRVDRSPALGMRQRRTGLA
jgi:hypothetical protein